MIRLSRPIRAGLPVLALLAPLAAGPVSAQSVLSAEEEAAKRLGFYFALSLESTSQRGMANGIGVVVDEPNVFGDFDVDGPIVDGDFQDRFNFGFKLGFRLRNDKGRIEANYWQFDEKQDLLRVAPEGKKIANTLASPGAGFFEDVGRRFVPGPPDGQVIGYEAGALSEGNEREPAVVGGPNPIDGAEDWNFNGRPDFIRFDTSDRIVGSIETDLKQFDVDYVRRIKRLRRFELDGRAGLRIASLSQVTDLGYRQLGSFAVYNDREADEVTSPRPCGQNVNLAVQDGDGDGETETSQNERDGDGFMDGDCDGFVFDELESVETVSEDRILARIETEGIGLRLGLDGRFQLSKKWSVSGGVALNLMSTDVEYRYREVFTSERDRFLNFIDWDFNGDGVYDNLDLDFDGSCAGRPPEFCDPNVGDAAALAAMGSIAADMRAGVQDSVVQSPAGLTQANSYNPGLGNLGRIRPGDAVGEPERNVDVLRETTVLQDVAGSDSGFQPMLDLFLGAEYQFSRFARLDFGLRASRWFGAGRFRTLADDVNAGGAVDITDGDFTTDGYFVRLTVVPR
jgi:hypothetical protein